MAGRLRYLLTLSRPRFWFYLAGPVVVGVVYAARGAGDLFGALPVALFAYFLVPANVYLYGVNDVYDRDTDAHNPKKKKGREARFTGEQWVVAVVALCAALGVALLGWLPPVAWLPTVGFVALGWAYSGPPLRLKTVPFLDSLSNGLYVLPGVAAYAALAGSLPPVAYLVGGWLWTMGMHTFSAIPDVGPDRAAGIRTTATVLGSRTYAYVAACWALAALAFGLRSPLAGLLLAVYPVFCAAVAYSAVDVERAYWWFPALNTLVGTVLTLAGLWGVVHG